jgi:hypothetical protein
MEKLANPDGMDILVVLLTTSSQLNWYPIKTTISGEPMGVFFTTAHIFGLLVNCSSL